MRVPARQRRPKTTTTPGPEAKSDLRSSPTISPMAMRTPTSLQPKLTVNSPGDRYEQEADRVADEVMRMSEPKIQRLCPECEEKLQQQSMAEEEKQEDAETLQTKPIAGSITPLIQRQTEPSEEDKTEEEEILQTKPASGEASIAFPALQNQITALQGGGQPLPESERYFFEPRFGADFSQVRVHADGQAAEAARAVNARAFTLGRDVIFGGGWYQPRSAEGQQTDDQKERERGGQPVTGVRLCHRVFDLRSPLWRFMPARHCYVAAVTESGSVDKALTATFDSEHSGTPDAVPTKADWVCSDPYPVSFETVRSKYKELCDPAAFQLGANNCCSCADRALKASGVKPRPGDFPATNLGTGLDPSEHSKGWKSEALGLFTTAPMGDTEIRSFVAGKTPTELSAIPLEGKIMLIDRLLSGWVSNEDRVAIEKVIRSSSEQDRGRLRAIYNTRARPRLDVGTLHGSLNSWLSSYPWYFPIGR